MVLLQDGLLDLSHFSPGIYLDFHHDLLPRHQEHSIPRGYFSHFLTFMLLGTVIGVPFSVFLGWLHLKKTSAWSAEQDISSEANPYYYKLLPGYWQEAFVPFYLELLRQNRKILASSKLLSSEDEARISELEKKLETLISGGYVGQPRRRRWVEASERH